MGHAQVDLTLQIYMKARDHQSIEQQTNWFELRVHTVDWMGTYRWGSQEALRSRPAGPGQFR